MQKEQLFSAWACPNQPQPLFRQLDQYITEQCGHQLLTFLLVDGAEVARLYSSNPAAYPVSGRKPMGPTQWGEKLITKGEPWLGRDKAAIEWAFYDHELIFSLGLGSAISVPARYDGRTIGVISMLDSEHHYHEAHLRTAMAIVPFIVPAFLTAKKS